MKPKILLPLLVILSLLIAAGAYFWATGTIASNYAYRSPLQHTPPEPGEPLGESSTRRLVIILVDALRYDTSLRTDTMPVLASLREQGASATMHSQPPSYSEPGYSTILTGAWPEINDGPTINLDYEEIPTFTQDNLFSAAKRTGLRTGISGYYWFEKLVPQQDVDLFFYTPGEDAAADREVVDAALPWLEDTTPGVFLIHIDQVDYAGHHEGGAASDNWLAAANRSDSLIGEILAKLDLSQDTLVVLSDHGQIDAGGHGGQDPVTLVEPFVIAGKAVIPGTYPDIQMVDVAPTLAALIGANLPASTQGQVQAAMLALPEQVTTSLPEATKLQQTVLTRAYLQAVNPKTGVSLPTGSQVEEYQAVIHKVRSSRLFSDRVLRAIPAALVLAALVTLLIRLRKSGSLQWGIAGLVTAALFNLRYALVDQRTYSLSSVTGEMDLILYVGITSLISFLAAWLVVMLTGQRFRLIPLPASLFSFGLSLTTILVLFLPVLLSFVLNGALVTWTLPDYLTSFLALLGLIQILIIAVLTPLFAGLSALISKLLIRNQKKPNSLNHGEPT
jgi:hypothetical protein